MATHFSILAWKIPWTGEPDGLQSTGSQRVDTTEGQSTHTHTRTHTHTFTHTLPQRIQEKYGSQHQIQNNTLRVMCRLRRIFAT